MRSVQKLLEKFWIIKNVIMIFSIPALLVSIPDFEKNEMVIYLSNDKQTSVKLYLTYPANLKQSRIMNNLFA